MRRQISAATPDGVGAVKEKWWQTKKILDWTFETPMNIPGPLLEKLGPLVASVSLEQKMSEERIRFVARSEWFKEIESETLEKLKEEVGAAFRDQILAHTEVVWSDWIEIEIKRHEMGVDNDGFTTKTRNRGDERGGSANLDFEYKILKRATFPDGRDMVLENRSLYPFPKDKKAGTDREDRYSRGQYHQSDDSQYTYIPATPENLAAMADVVRRLDELEQRLHGVLSPSQIQKTLKLITGGNLALEDKR